MGMKEDNDEVTTKTRILSLELLQVSSNNDTVYLLLQLSKELKFMALLSTLCVCKGRVNTHSLNDGFCRGCWRELVTPLQRTSLSLTL